jgi:hypothetical protein
MPTYIGSNSRCSSQIFILNISTSQHLSIEKAVVLFDRAKAKIQAKTPEGLTVHIGWPKAARSLGIRGI